MEIPPPVRDRGSLSLLDWLDVFYAAWRRSIPLRSETCEVHEGTNGTQILPHANKAGSAAVAAPCALFPTMTEVASVKKVSFEWGTICKRQPTGFAANGKLLVDAVSGNYYYAKATASLTNMQWISSEIYPSPDAALANTTTEAYELKAWCYTDDAGVLQVNGVCGIVTFDFCDLLPA